MYANARRMYVVGVVAVGKMRTTRGMGGGRNRFGALATTKSRIPYSCMENYYCNILLFISVFCKFTIVSPPTIFPGFSVCICIQKM